MGSEMCIRDSPEGPLVLTTEAALIGLAIGITVTILSSLLPARKASQVSPMEAIRDSVSTPRRKSLFIRLVFGSLISVAGFGMLFGVLLRSKPKPGSTQLLGSI